MDPLTVQFVLDRDGYQCLVCGSDHLIQVAHIESRGARPDLKNEPSNLCVLCFECHMLRQHQHGTLEKSLLQDLMKRKHGYDYDGTSDHGRAH